MPDLLTYWEAVAPDMSEAVFQAHVVREAKALGYRVYHTHDARRSAKGFPDLVLVRPASRRRDGAPVIGRVVFVELKAARGKLTKEQDAWRQDLRAAGAECYAPVRPADFDRLLDLLDAGGMT